jgi:hypothetical protein
MNYAQMKVHGSQKGWLCHNLQRQSAMLPAVKQVKSVSEKTLVINTSTMYSEPIKSYSNLGEGRARGNQYQLLDYHQHLRQL